MFSQPWSAWPRSWLRRGMILAWGRVAVVMVRVWFVICLAVISARLELFSMYVLGSIALRMEDQKVAITMAIKGTITAAAG